jgi:hypothetical protein
MDHLEWDALATIAIRDRSSQGSSRGVCAPPEDRNTTPLADCALDPTSSLATPARRTPRTVAASVAITAIVAGSVG